MKWWSFVGCRRCALFVLATASATLALACDGDEQGTLPAHDAGMAPSRLVEDIAAEDPHRQSRLSARYYQGYLDDTLRGDVAAARRAYEDVIAEAGERPELAALAALRLAELEFLAGRRREALELMARASVLGRDDTVIVERADRLQTRLASLRSDGSQVRGPPIGAELSGASSRAAQAFAEAEELLQAYYRVRLEPRLEQLRAGVRAKQNAMEAALRAYRAVLELGEPAADVAAEFRSASLQHDLALSLMFDLPPELEPRARVRLRRSLRASAIGHLRVAGAAYQRCLQRAASARGAPAGSPNDEPAERIETESPRPSTPFDRWTVAAELGLRSVRDLLGGGGDRPNRPVSR